MTDNIKKKQVRDHIEVMGMHEYYEFVRFIELLYEKKKEVESRGFTDIRVELDDEYVLWEDGKRQFMCISGNREETDEEAKQRTEQEVISKALGVAREKEQYERLKKKFEGGN